MKDGVKVVLKEKEQNVHTLSPEREREGEET